MSENSRICKILYDVIMSLYHKCSVKKEEGGDNVYYSM